MPSVLTFTAIKKSDLYSFLWASYDELRGGLDAKIVALALRVVKTHQIKRRMV